MITRDQIIEEARSWLGTPFRHQGRVKGVGCDCAGLVVGVASALGLADFTEVAYGRNPRPQKMGAVLDEYLTKKPLYEALPGDVIWMAFGKDPMHLAIKTDYGMIHSTSEIGKVVEHGIDDLWNSRFRECYAFRGIE